MIISSVGVVLCRLAAIVLFVRAAIGIGGSIQMFAESLTPVWTNLIILVFIGAAPAVIGAGIWIYAERISRLSAGVSEAEESHGMRPADLIMVGSILIGLYAVLFGIVDGFAAEAGFLAEPDLGDNVPVRWTTDSAQRLARRIPYIVQVALGLFLILGRERIARLLLKARYAGTGAK